MTQVKTVTLGKEKTNLVKKIRPILKDHGATKAALFGSAARGQLTKNSDVDVLIEIKKNIGIFDLIRLKLRLEKILKRKVDLVEYSAVKSALKAEILKDQLPIL